METFGYKQMTNIRNIIKSIESVSTRRVSVREKYLNTQHKNFIE